MSVDSIHAALLGSIPARYQKTAGFPMWLLTRAMALGLDAGEAALNEAESKLDPENLTGAELESYIYYRTGQSRMDASIAGGVVSVTGKGTVNTGDIFATDGGVLFASGEDVEVDGSAEVRVSCLTEGAVGNVPAGAVCRMPVQLPGITAVTNAAAMDGGADAESDAALLERFLTHLQHPPNGANAWQYREWAVSISGVGDAKVFPLGHGDGTVDVVLIGADGTPASDTLVRQVQNYIDPGSSGYGEGAAPIGAVCYVSAATAKTVSLAVQVARLAGAELNDVQASVKAAVQTYLKTIAFEQDYVSLARVGEAILSADGVQDYADLTLNGKTANVALTAREVAVLGEVTVIDAQ